MPPNPSPSRKPFPKPHRYDFRTLKRACILFTEPDRGQHIQQENVGCEDKHFRHAIAVARRAFERAMEKR